MSRNIKMLFFVLVMGLVTSGLLLGADTITKERIEMNQQAQLQSAILDAYELDYQIANIGQIFDDYIETREIDGLTFYIVRETGEISYQFSGLGVWGEIRAVISFEEDFETIRRIRVLQQEETPGLGGVIADEGYLENFIGKSMADGILISQTADDTLDSEVDAITGATRTSYAFEGMLNDSYETYKEVWTEEGGHGDA